MRTSYQSTTSRPSPSGPNATRGRRAGRSTAAATTRGSSSPGQGKSSSACRNSAARPSGRLSSSATAGARPRSRRPSSRCTWRASQPGGSRTSPSSPGGRRCPPRGRCATGSPRRLPTRNSRRSAGAGSGRTTGSAHQPRDQEEDEGRRNLPGRQLDPHAGDGETEVHSEAKCGKRRCLDISKLDEMDELKGEAKGQKRMGPRTAKSICERIMTVPENVTQPLTLPSSHYDN